MEISHKYNKILDIGTTRETILARIDYFCDMEILEIHSLDALAGGGCNVPAGGAHEMPSDTVSGATPYIPSDVMVADLLGLMKELDPTLKVTPAMLRAAAEKTGT